MSNQLRTATNLFPRLMWTLIVIAAVGLVTSATLSQDPAEPELLRQIHDLLLGVLNLELSNDTDVIEAGLLDSLALVELLVAIEREFSVEIDLETLDLDDLRTPRKIASTVARAKQQVASTEAQSAGT